MADILKFLKDRAKNVEHVAQAVQRGASRTFDQVNPADNNRTWQNPQGNASQQVQNNQAPPSAFHQLTHSGASNVLGGTVQHIPQFALNYANMFANLGRKAAGVSAQTPQEQFTDPLTSSMTRMSNPNGTIRQTLGDVAQIGLDVATPSVDNLVAKGVEKVIAPSVPKIVTRVASNAGTGAVVGGPYNVAAEVSGNEDLTPKSVVDAYIKGTEGGAAMGAGGAIASHLVPKVGASVVRVAKKVPEAVDTIDKRAFGDAPEVAQGGYVSNNSEMVPHEPTPSEVPPINGGPQANPKPMQQAGFTGNVQASREVSDPVKGRVSAAYEASTNADLTANSEDLMRQGIDKAHDAVVAALNKKEGSLSDQEVAHAITLAKTYDQMGGDANYELAANIYDRLANHLTEAGKTVQAASLLNVRSPEGLQYGAIKALKKAGVEVTPELQQNMQRAIEGVKATAENTPERDMAVKEFAKVVTDSIPSSIAEKLTATWKAGLLTGIKTQTGNALSNGTFGALHAISNPLAAAIDKAMSVVTGERTKTLTARGTASGVIEGVKKGGQYIKSGIDERSVVTNKLDQGKEVNFKNPALRAYVNGVFRLMGAADRPAYYAQLRNSLNDIAIAEAKNQGLNGAERSAFIKDFIENPSDQAFQVATDEAEKAVLGNNTLLGNIASGIRRAGDQLENPLARGTAHVATNVLMPFTKVPSAFISRVIDFTPVGAFKEAVSQIASDNHFDQRKLATAISEATTGTAIIYLGMKLAQSGVLSGNYPDDPKEQARWKSEGITPNSIHVGDQWLSLNYFGPIGSLFSQGKRIADSQAEGESVVGQGLAASSGIAQDALGQSFLQGASGALDAVTDPKRYAANYVKNQAASTVPTIVGDVAAATDKKQREVNSPGDAVKNKVPGARETLPVSQDVYGNDLSAKTSSINTLLNPLRPSDEHTNDVTTEIARLHNVDPNNKDLQLTPTPIDKVVTMDGTKVKLSPEQRHDLQDKVGSATQDSWRKVIASDEYKKMSDTDKATTLEKVRRDTAAVAMEKYAQDKKLGQYAPGFTGKEKKLTKQQQALAEDGVKASDYAPSNKSTSSTTSSDFYKSSDAEYKDALEKFNEKKKKGELSDAQQIRQQQQLDKLKVGSTYDKNIRDLYNLSKTQIYNYVTTNKDGQSISEKLQSYDQALYDAGITTYLKFKKGMQPAAKTSSKSSSSSRSRSTSSKKTSSRKVKLPSISTAKLAKIPSVRVSTKSKGFKIPHIKSGIKTPKVGKLKTYHVAAKA